MAQTVQVGIVGCGVIAATHIESFQALDNARVKWACDLREERARERAQKYGIAEVTTDYRQLLDDPEVDLISVCTDHASHAEIAVAALKAGKHVVCEKSLSASHEGLEQMLRAHREHPDLVFSGIFQHRFDGVNRRIKELIDAGALGTLLTASMSVRCLRKPAYYADDWHGTWDREGGSVLINQAIHTVDTLQWLMGGVESLAATYANLEHQDTIETEDTITVSCRFGNGALGAWEATSGSHLDWEISYAVHGSVGSIEVRDGKATKVRFADEALERRVAQELASANDPRGVEAGKSYYGTGHPAQIADVVEAIVEGRAPFVTAEQAAQSTRIVLTAYESHRQGRRLPVPTATPAKAAAS